MPDHKTYIIHIFIKEKYWETCTKQLNLTLLSCVKVGPHSDFRAWECADFIIICFNSKFRFAGDFVDTSTVRSQRSLIVTEDDPSVTSADRSCRPKQRPLPAVQSTSRHRRKKKLSAPLPPTSSDENGLADTYIKKAATTQDMKPKELPINKWVSWNLLMF